MAIEKLICAECGCVIGQDENCVIFDEKTFCQDCAERVLIWCEHCEDYGYAENSCQVLVSDYRNIHETWCEDCIENDASVCEDCGTVVDRDCARYVDEHGYICYHCMDDYYYCDSCDEYVHYTQWDNDLDMCSHCASEQGYSLRIKSYHGNDKTRKIGELMRRWYGIWRGLGIELEIDRDEPSQASEKNTVEKIVALAGDGIVFERDGSLRNGFEIITLPHTEKAFNLLPWEEILKACVENGYKSHETITCGLHIHISREMLGSTQEKQEKALAKMLYFYENNFEDIIKISRRKENAVAQWAQAYGVSTREDCEYIAKNQYNYGRYHCVNLTNSRTIEIRIMRGTLNYNTFMACIDFVLHIAKRSRSIKWKGINDIEKWLHDLKPSTQEYLKTRHAFEGRK